ncbi:hypothetical protein [Mannheimia pernigra]|uniref:hypothetical protein n=1 Tax=Mannheimia pernigra TaxID=111844 RepID=UPI001316030B|nr:hypothetical protein [Mannheimia pernigra]QHB17199.1 hypothetical protein GM695_03680 [Mannheimia pernigra]
MNCENENAKNKVETIGYDKNCETNCEIAKQDGLLFYFAFLGLQNIGGFGQY